MASTLGFTTTFAQVLADRGFDADDRTRAFLDPKLGSLTPPDEMADRAVAVDRIVSAVKRKERVVVFGDYDCDGITSSAILTEAIQILGGDVHPLVGNRFEGGYGLSDAGADRVAQAGADLLITCDCGSSDHERLDRLRRQGIDAVVLDHHLVPGEPLPATAFLNPHRPDCGYPYKNLASCGLALNLAAGLRRELRPDLDVRRWLDLVAIGTVADMVPLDGDNRILVRAGMKMLGTSTRPGLRALAEQARMSLAAGVTSETIAFKLAPRLNAPGRLGDASLALRLLLETDPNLARGLAASIEQVKQDRQKIQAEVLQEALAQIKERGFEQDPAFVLGKEGWHPGVVGIVAANLVDQFHKPAVVIGFDGAVGRGSVRGPDSLSVYDLLADSRDPDVDFGGHSAAAGVTLSSRASLERLRDKFCAATKEQRAGITEKHRPVADVLLEPGDAPFQVVKDFDWLEPCGVGNPTPVVGVSDAEVTRATSVRGGHLQLVLTLAGGAKLYGFAASRGDQSSHLPVGTRVNVTGTISRDTFRGGDAVGMSVKCIEVL